MTITHIVLFEWKPSASHAQVEEVSTLGRDGVHLILTPYTLGMQSNACSERSVPEHQLSNAVHQVILRREKQQ